MKLRKLVADLALDRKGCKTSPPQALKPGLKRGLAGAVFGEWKVSIWRAFAVLEFDTSSYHYNSC